MKLILTLFLLITLSDLYTQHRINKQISRLQNQVESFTKIGYYKKALVLNAKLSTLLETTTKEDEIVITQFQSVKLNYLLGVPYKQWNSSLSNLLSGNSSASNTFFEFTLKNKAIALYLDYGLTKVADSLEKTLDHVHFKKVNEIDLFEAVRNFVLLTTQKGYYDQAIVYIQDHKQKYLQALSSTIPTRNSIKKQDKQKKDQLNRQYADLCNLETVVLIKAGKFSTALALNNKNASWILKHLNNKDLAYIDNKLLRAQILLKQEKFEEASTNFNQIFHKQVTKTNHGLSYKPTHPKYIKLIEQAAIAHWTVNRNNDANEVYHYITPQIKRYYPKTSIYRIWIDILLGKKQMIRGDYFKAANTFEDILSASTYTQDHPSKIAVYQDLLNCYIELKYYRKCTDLIEKIQRLNKTINLDKTPKYELELFSTAKYEVLFKNKLKQAIHSYEDGIRLNIEAGSSLYSPNLITLLNDKALYLLESNKPSESKELLDNTTKAVLTHYGSTHFLYAKQLERLSHYYAQTGKYNLAYQKAVLSVAILKKYRFQNIRFAECLRTFASSCILRGQFKDAESALIKAQGLSDNHYNALDIDEFSRLYLDNGRYSKVETILLASFDRKQVFFGPLNKRLIPTLLQLSELYLILGNYPKADDYNDKASLLTENIFGIHSLKYASCVKLQGDINTAIGDYEGAIKNYTAALQIEEQQFGSKNIITAETAIKVLLARHYNGDQTTQIEKLLRKEVHTIEAAFPDKVSPIVAEALTLFAIYQAEIGHYTSADRNLVKADHIWRKSINLKKGNKYSANILMLRATLNTYQKNYEEALLLYQNAANMYKAIFNKSHPEYVHILGKMGQLHYLLGNENKALKITTESTALNMKLVNDFFPALSERAKTQFWNKNKSDFEFYNTLAFSSEKNAKKLAGKVYDHKLATKSLLLNSSIKIRDNILNSNDTSLIRLYRNYLSKREDLVKILSASNDKLTAIKDPKAKLQKEIDELEEELSQRSQLFENVNKAKTKTWQDVQANLKANEYALEIIRYRVFDKKFSDSVVYLGLLINNETINTPKVIIIPDGKRLENEDLKYYRNSIKYRVTDSKSYTAFWKPIVSSIPDSATLYISAEGVYNQINPETFFDGSKYELNKHQIVYVTSTKNIGSVEKSVINYNKALLVANPKYYENKKGQISQLVGAEKEAKNIEKILKANNIHYNTLIGAEATEQAIKATEQPRFVHLATHGYFIENTSDQNIFVEIDENKAIENPLLKSGLLLTNAGDVIDKNNYYHYNNADGVLTALETMNLNWSNAEFVVLSACETGLGEIKNGEGVYGLQRTLQLAGARAIIMSLFKVDDAITNNLMELFYKYHFSRNFEKKEAFIMAKKEIQKTYKDPIFWGAFILID